MSKIKKICKKAIDNAKEGKGTTVIGTVIGVAAALTPVLPISPVIGAAIGALALIFGVGKKSEDK